MTRSDIGRWAGPVAVGCVALGGVASLLMLLFLSPAAPQPLQRLFPPNQDEVLRVGMGASAWSVDLRAPAPRVEPQPPTPQPEPVDEPPPLPPPPDVTVWGITRVTDGRVLATVQMPDGRMYTATQGETIADADGGVSEVLAIDRTEVTLRIGGENFTYTNQAPGGDGGGS